MRGVRAGRAFRQNSTHLMTWDNFSRSVSSAAPLADTNARTVLASASCLRTGPVDLRPGDLADP
jgi:hypothetical protein